jgi:hypothetical protein
VDENSREDGAVDDAERMSAMRPKAKHIVDIEIPIMVRNCKCQPYEEFYISDQSQSNVIEITIVQHIALTN